MGLVNSYRSNKIFLKSNSFVQCYWGKVRFSAHVMRYMHACCTLHVARQKSKVALSGGAAFDLPPFYFRRLKGSGVDGVVLSGRQTTALPYQKSIFVCR